MVVPDAENKIDLTSLGAINAGFVGDNAHTETHTATHTETHTETHVKTKLEVSCRAQEMWITLMHVYIGIKFPFSHHVITTI